MAEPDASSGDPPALTVFRLHACPHCERVVRVLNDLGLAYHSRFVLPDHSTRDAVRRASGSRTVPVLVDERKDLTVTESENIIAYLESAYGSGD